MKTIPRWVHIPWYLASLGGVMICISAYPQEPAYRHPAALGWLLAFMAWCWCSRWMR